MRQWRPIKNMREFGAKGARAATGSAVRDSHLHARLDPAKYLRDPL
jgi:hypothetical protein